jgi:hypothetical protein
MPCITVVMKRASTAGSAAAGEVAFLLCPLQALANECFARRAACSNRA